MSVELSKADALLIVTALDDYMSEHRRAATARQKAQNHGWREANAELLRQVKRAGDVRRELLDAIYAGAS